MFRRHYSESFVCPDDDSITRPQLDKRNQLRFLVTAMRYLINYYTAGVKICMRNIRRRTLWRQAVFLPSREFPTSPRQWHSLIFQSVDTL